MAKSVGKRRIKKRWDGDSAGRLKSRQRQIEISTDSVHEKFCSRLQFEKHFHAMRLQKGSFVNILPPFFTKREFFDLISEKNRLKLNQNGLKSSRFRLKRNICHAHRRFLPLSLSATYVCFEKKRLFINGALDFFQRKSTSKSKLTKTTAKRKWAKRKRNQRNRKIQRSLLFLDLLFTLFSQSVSKSALLIWLFKSCWAISFSFSRWKTTRWRKR